MLRHPDFTICDPSHNQITHLRANTVFSRHRQTAQNAFWAASGARPQVRILPGAPHQKHGLSCEDRSTLPAYTAGRNAHASILVVS